ncbi:Digestive cysteine proteinase 1 [Papilio machaon]|uniref:Digestive cysteine proteinase 1 n=1 Tax=Papilio machaon TaxID=76193 RepID=A0A0N1PGI5_PAPMA|nr:Digestive cysteine proteinase 1 [Papilio machaon]
MSCWAFAVTGAVEGALFLRTRRLVPLSEKCLVDCAHTHGANGCKGTWPSRAYDYIRDRGLPALDEFTPYEPKVDECARPEPVTRISGHVNVTVNSVPALKLAIRRHAPTVVIVDATAKSFTTYSKGVLYDERCGKSRRPLNHAVLAVGWGEKRGEPHFILKNSWSTAWGEGGYVRVQARGNTCGVLSRPSYPRLEREDVLRAPTAAPAQSADGKSRRPLNHAVLAVGWGEKRGEPHFILKNSWSTAWGEGGYVRVQARSNTCGVLSRPSYPRLEREDVLRAPPAAPAASASPAQSAESDDLAAAEDALPRHFDWRPRGAVSPVRCKRNAQRYSDMMLDAERTFYQGQCMSCWAFAVTGAVEGALFLRTRRLVPLSEKCLIDCAHTLVPPPSPTVVYLA